MGKKRLIINHFKNPPSMGGLEYWRVHEFGGFLFENLDKTGEIPKAVFYSEMEAKIYIFLHKILWPFKALFPQTKGEKG